MTGGDLVGLILLSMGWLFFLGGLAMNFHALRRSLRAKEGERTPSGLGFVPGVVGSLTLFFSIPALARFGVEAPWPWLWILLPLALDPYCLGGFLLTLWARVAGRS
jgi:hypothetical protein